MKNMSLTDLENKFGSEEWEHEIIANKMSLLALMVFEPIIP